MRLKWLPKAVRNLEEEAAYIALDDPQVARLVVMRVLEAVHRLTERPGLGRPGRREGTRELPIARTRYVVPYRVRDDVIEVLRVFHTSRRPPSRW